LIGVLQQEKTNDIINLDATYNSCLMVSKKMFSVRPMMYLSPPPCVPDFGRPVLGDFISHWGQTLMHLDSRCLWGMFSTGCELVDKRLIKVLGWTKN
jgi:hypothetical protein